MKYQEKLEDHMFPILMETMRDDSHPGTQLFVFSHALSMRQARDDLYTIMRQRHVTIDKTTQDTIVTHSLGTFMFLSIRTGFDKIRGMSIVNSYIDITQEHNMEFHEFITQLQMQEVYANQMHTTKPKHYSLCGFFWWVRERWRDTLEDIRRSKEI